jgi:hypothetical protein
MLVHPGDAPRVLRTFDADVVWLNERPLDPGKSYFIKHTTQTCRANVDRVHWKKDMDTLADREADTLALNDIGRLTITSHRALFIDSYRANRETGSFILVDSITNATVAAGMIAGADRNQDLDAALRDARAGEVGEGRSQVSAKERRERFGVAGGIVVVTGEGAQALAFAIERALFDRGASAVVLGAGAGAARALRDAGLLAVVVAGGAPAGIGADEALVVQAEPGASPDAQARAVIDGLRKRGWV